MLKSYINNNGGVINEENPNAVGPINTGARTSPQPAPCAAVVCSRRSSVFHREILFEYRGQRGGQPEGP